MADDHYGDVEAPEPFPLVGGEVGQYRTGFHGTTHDLEGDHILSAAERREKGVDVPVSWPGTSSDQYVNYWHGSPSGWRGQAPATAEERAWTWANGEMDREGRPRVYEGVAEGIHGADANLLDEYLHDSDPDDEYSRGTYDRPLNLGVTEELLEQSDGAPPMAAERFRVTDTHWIPPSATGAAIQGTLPNVNWNQFGAPNVGNPEDVLPMSLTPFDQEVAVDRQIAARTARKSAKEAARPLHGPALPNAARDAERRSVEAGQMRLPGF